MTKQIESTVAEYMNSARQRRYRLFIESGGIRFRTYQPPKTKPIGKGKMADAMATASGKSAGVNPVPEISRTEQTP